MARGRKPTQKANGNGAKLGFEATLWQAADALRGNMDASEYKRGEDLGLTDDELAFYEALEVNDSAVQVLGDKTLRAIAQELLDTVRRDATIDWTLKENVRAKLRRNVRRILNRHGYPPDKREQATQTVLEQAELMAAEGLAA